MVKKNLELQFLLRAKNIQFENCLAEKSELKNKIEKLTDKDNTDNQKKFLLERILNMQPLLRANDHSEFWKATNEELQKFFEEKSQTGRKIHNLTEKEFEELKSRIIQIYQNDLATTLQDEDNEKKFCIGNNKDQQLLVNRKRKNEFQIDSDTCSDSTFNSRSLQIWPRLKYYFKNHS